MFHNIVLRSIRIAFSKASKHQYSKSGDSMNLHVVEKALEAEVNMKRKILKFPWTFLSCEPIGCCLCALSVDASKADGNISASDIASDVLGEMLEGQ
ncbi:proliferation-associated protein 2g4 [Echinococcus multilocularis]|uniref:Proliferation-associated protein 2g4 n=1 Tax=Echinococcus multilocularis TaxID=6211 RepID=A0A0S4MIK9_ECHMU|nr:proliferation-associated protein 2g4 [Echinococcus multilocularis]